METTTTMMTQETKESFHFGPLPNSNPTPCFLARRFRYRNIRPLNGMGGRRSWLVYRVLLLRVLPVTVSGRTDSAQSSLLNCSGTSSLFVICMPCRKCAYRCFTLKCIYNARLCFCALNSDYFTSAASCLSVCLSIRYALKRNGSRSNLCHRVTESEWRCVSFIGHRHSE